MRKPQKLSGLGALRWQLGSPGDEGWAEAVRAELGDERYLVARELAKCVPGDDAELRGAVLALAGACLWSAGGGSTRLPIGTVGEGALAKLLAQLKVPPAVATRAFAVLAASPTQRGAATRVLSAPGEFKPLIVDGEAICLQRLLAHERDLGARLKLRLVAICSSDVLEQLEDEDGQLHE